ncbi:MAG: radical SAM protein [Patescibacteria group bacterium]
MSQDNQKNLDCLLIAPPDYYGDENNIWREINSNFPPLGLASIAGYVRQQDQSVEIIDCEVSCPSVQAFGDYLKENFVDHHRDIRVIGFTATTGQIKKAYQAAEICRLYYPNALIIFGGVHATFVTDEVINQPFVDAVVIGEGEITLGEILSGKKIEEIDGVVYKKELNGEKQIIRNAPRRRIANLDDLPLPAYDLLPIDKYRPAKGSYKKLPAMSLMTSRGCPGRCTFCNKTLGDQMIFKSATGIFAEIKYLADNYGIRQIMFYDDTFTVFRQNVIDLCDLLIKNKMDLSWTCFARVDYVDEAMLRKMSDAGCHQIMYGVENVDEAVLKNINKKINLPQVINAVKWTKQAGIECRLAFMVGNPGDSRQVIEKNIRFVKKINPDLLIVNITTPFPGTAMFNWAKERDLLLSENWDDFNLAKPVMRLENLSAEEIKNLYKIMYRSFYFRPKFILKKIFSIRSLDDIKILFDGFMALVSFFLPKSPDINTKRD